MSQVISDGCQFGTFGQRMCGMGAPHPMVTCPAQLFCRFRGIGLNGIGCCYEETFGDIPQP